MYVYLQRVVSCGGTTGYNNESVKQVFCILTNIFFFFCQRGNTKFLEHGKMMCILRM